MKYLKYTLICLLGLLFAECTDSLTPSIPKNDGNAQIIGDKINLTLGFDISDFQEATTRAFSDEPTLDNLHLYIIEFVDNGSPLINTRNAEVYRPTEKKVAGDVVKYNVTLNRTDQPRILHFIAVEDDKLVVPNGVEGSVMPGLTSQNSNVAYWRRLEFKNGYCEHITADGKDEWEFNEDFRNQLLGTKETGPKNLKLVRNFAKITVGMAEGAITPVGSGMSFMLEDFMIVNTPMKGTMVPYSSTGATFPEFLDSDGNPLSYEEVSKNYSGITPANTTLNNQITSEDSPVMGSKTLTDKTDGVKTYKCLPPEFVYERPFSTLSRTYIIIKDKYDNSLTNPDTEKSYYDKLDLVNKDVNSIFRYFGILRNFNYFIRINGVATAGYETAWEAATGTVYNNISFDIDTDNLINLSDGKDLIKVNYTTVVVTDNGYEFDFKYAFKDNILGAENGVYKNELVDVIGLEPGNVIEDVTLVGEETDANQVKWKTYHIKCKNPKAVTETQEFTVIRKSSGLGRTVTLVSHLKWDFENLREYAGIWENYPNTYNGLYRQKADGSKGTEITGLTNSAYSGLCGTQVGSQFTIFFDIPDNIPEVLFPLEFTIESDHQGLENEPMGTIVVAPGPSLFSQNGEENRIQYRKSVTWTEYNSPLRMDVRDDNGTVIGDPEAGPVTHRVRCRFRTIETVDNNTHIRVRIANDNFNWGHDDADKCTVEFDRVTTANTLAGPGLIWVEPTD